MQKIAVVTGGSRGIGFSIVKKLLSEGFRVFSVSRALGQLQDLAKEFPVDLVIHHADLGNKNEVLAYAEKVKTATGRIDMLVNNAGLFMPGEIHMEEEGAFEMQMNLNVAAPYHLTRALLPLMIPHRDGYVFNICSTASIVPYSNGGSYCISKHAILGFSKVLRQELMPHDIAVSSILPGATLTDSWAGTDLPEDRFIQPDYIAECLWFAWKNKKHMVMEEVLLRPMLGDL